MKKEQVRKNGYYLIDGINYPAVSTITRSCMGDTFALTKWAIHQGSDGIVQSFLKNKALLDDSHPNLITMAREIAYNAYSKELNRTANFGTNVHKAIEVYCEFLGKKQNDLLKNVIEDQCLNLTEMQRKCFRTFCSGLDDIIDDVIQAEGSILSQEFRYAGRFDLLASIKSKDSLKPFLKRSSDKTDDGSNLCLIDFKTGSFDKDGYGRQIAAYAKAARNSEDEIISGMVLNVERENPEELSIHYYSPDSLDSYFKDFMKMHDVWASCFAPKWWGEQFNN